jgi:hypothetical protein
LDRFLLQIFDYPLDNNHLFLYFLDIEADFGQASEYECGEREKDSIVDELLQLLSLPD